MKTRRSPSLVISHWDKLLGDLQVSPRGFYASIEEAIGKRRLPGTKTFRMDWREGSPFSARREYLRVARQEYVFDICGAPFGTGGFFVSWWLGELPSLSLSMLSRIRFLGAISDSLARPATYYRIDRALMFQSAIHASVLEVIDAISAARGIRPLPDLERRPIMRNFFEA